VVVPQTAVPWTVPGSQPELTDEQVAELPEVWRKWIERRRQRAADAKTDVTSAGDLGTVFELLDDLARRFNIDQDRVYVLGHSMGGFGSWTAVCEEPDRFAAAIPTAGGCPPWRDVKRFAHVPIWTFHGDQDKTVPVELTRFVFRQLDEIDGNTKYTELKGVGHGANAHAFAYTGDDEAKGFVTRCAGDACDKTSDVWDWLFAQTHGRGK
jgi:predicted peptidase